MGNLCYEFGNSIWIFFRARTLLLACVQQCCQPGCLFACISGGAAAESGPPATDRIVGQGRKIDLIESSDAATTGGFGRWGGVGEGYESQAKRIATFVATGRFGLAFPAAAEVERKTKYHKYLWFDGKCMLWRVVVWERKQGWFCVDLEWRYFCWKMHVT